MPNWRAKTLISSGRAVGRPSGFDTSIAPRTEPCDAQGRAKKRPKTSPFRRARKKRKHSIGYYLMCGAPMDPLTHLEQLFAEGEPVWTAEFGAVPGARKPAADEQGVFEGEQNDVGD